MIHNLNIYVSKEINQPWSTANDHTTFPRHTHGSDYIGKQWAWGLVFSLSAEPFSIRQTACAGLLHVDNVTMNAIINYNNNNR